MYLRNPCDWDLADGTAIVAANAGDQFGMCDPFNDINDGCLVDIATDRSALAFPGRNSVRAPLQNQSQNSLGWLWADTPTEIWVSADFMLPTTPGNSTTRLIQLQDQDGFGRFGLAVTNTDQLAVRNITTNVNGVIHALTHTVWYHLDWHVLFAGTAGQVTYDLTAYTAADMEVAFTGGTGGWGLGTGVTSFGGLWLGAINNGAVTYTGWNLRNVQVSDEGPPGVLNPREGFGSALVAA